MNTFFKMTILRYTLLVLTLAAVFTSCQQAGTSENIAKSSKPPQRKIKNGAQYAEDVNSGKIRKDDFIGSPVRTTSLIVGDCRISLRYSSPGVKGREIWGKLVPYNNIWVTGANHATAISFDKEVGIDKRRIPAGTYALFTIPGKGDWTVILNKDADQHLTDDYSKKEDVMRLTVHSEQLPAVVQRLTYQIIQKGDNTAEIKMEWEKLGIGFVIHTLQNK